MEEGLRTLVYVSSHVRSVPSGNAIAGRPTPKSEKAIDLKATRRAVADDEGGGVPSSKVAESLTSSAPPSSESSFE